MPYRVLFVCSGNICRSPTAEVVLRQLVRDRGLADVVEVASAGTGDWHAGQDMDRRSRATLVEAGYAPRAHTAQQATPSMLGSYDLVVALDSGHLADLRALGARDARLLRDFDPSAPPGDRDVGDPYYGGPDGFAEVLAQIERACAGLLDAIAPDLCR